MSFLRKFIQSVFLLSPFFLHAQTYPFINYGVQDGLSQSNVSAIIQDHSGYIWLATESGVSRFDGRNFTNYTTENGLADNNVSALLLDNKGRIWMGYENGMLSRFDGKNFTTIKCELLPKEKKIYSLYQDMAGSVWISTASFGVIQIINPEKEAVGDNCRAFLGKDGLSQYVISTFEDENRVFWFLTDVGIKQYDPTAKKFEFFRPEGMPPGQMTCLMKDSHGDFLIGTSSGNISRFSQKEKKMTAVLTGETLASLTKGASTNFVYALHEDSKGNTWASIFNYGVCRVEAVTGRATLFNTTNGLTVNKIKCISEDREGNILLGTLGSGMEVFKGEKFVSFSTSDGLINNQVWAICKDKNSHYWLGTNEGISVYSPEQPTGKSFQSIFNIDGINGNYNVRSIVEDKNRNLWMGTWGGKVAMYDISKSKFVIVPELNEIVNPLVSCLLVDRKNQLWIGTVEGIVCYDIGSKKIKTIRTIDGLSDNDITCIYEDSKGDIWIGTKQKGITVYNGNSYKKINSENGLTYNSITSIAEDSRHRIWIGTEGGGVFLYHENAFTNYKVKDGLVSDFVTLITIDANNNVWLGTNNGLCKYDYAKNVFYSYLKNDGFTGIETKPKAVFNDAEGKIWFGTVSGVFKYDPKLDLPVALDPITQITRFRVNLKDFPVEGKVELSYKENSLNFDFIGISLSNPEGVKYMVKLEGYDEDWRPTTKQTFEIYSNLPDGNYVFKVISCNSSGVYNEVPVSMSIVITPPFWRTWWFYITVCIIGLTAIFSFIKIRERNLIIEKRILEEKVKVRTAEVVSKNIELDEKNKDITASIRYAKRIQDAILPPDEYVRTYLPKTFVLFKPKDIVSGDFYWLADKKDMILFAAVDCTGHGVPGAFMSIVGHNLLDQIVAEHGHTKPAAILDELNKSVSDTLRQSYTEDNSVKDGMDISLCAFDRRTNIMEYAGAYNPLWLIRNGELTEIKANKFPIGNLKAGETKKFTNHSITLQEGDTLYIFSDGFADQFGGPQGKKLNYSAFKQLLLVNHHMSMEEQGAFLDKTIEKWRGELDQVDDILVIGTRL